MTIRMPLSLLKSAKRNVLKAFLWFNDFNQLVSSKSPTSHFQRATAHTAPKGLTIPVLSVCLHYWVYFYDAC